MLRHVWVVWRSGQLRFRLETFGLYYPAPPYVTPVWRVSPRNLVLLLRQSIAYLGWVVEMDEIRRGTARAPGRLRHVSRLWLEVSDEYLAEERGTVQDPL